MDGVKKVTPSSKGLEFEQSQSLGDDSQRASMIRTDITRLDMEGKPFGKWEGFYSHLPIDGTNPATKSSDTALDSVFVKNFPRRIYLILTADNPDHMTNTGDKLKDITSASRAFLVASPNISDDGKRVLFNPKDVDPDNRSKFKLKKDGTYAYQPTKEFKEYPIVKYLIGARWCGSHARMHSMKSELKRLKDWDYIPEECFDGKKDRRHRRPIQNVPLPGQLEPECERLSPIKPVMVVKKNADKSNKNGKKDEEHKKRKKKRKMDAIEKENKKPKIPRNNHSDRINQPKPAPKHAAVASSKDSVNSTGSQLDSQVNFVDHEGHGDHGFLSSLGEAMSGVASTPTTVVSPTEETVPLSSGSMLTHLQPPRPVPTTQYGDASSQSMPTGGPEYGQAQGYYGNSHPTQHQHPTLYQPQLHTMYPPPSATYPPPQQQHTAYPQPPPPTTYPQAPPPKTYPPPPSTAMYPPSAHHQQTCTVPVDSTIIQKRPDAPIFGRPADYTVSISGTTTGLSDVDKHQESQSFITGRGIGHEMLRMDTFELPDSPLFGDKIISRKQIMAEMYRFGGSRDNIGAVSQILLRLDAMNKRMKPSTSTRQGSSSRSLRNESSIPALLAKCPFRLPLRSREEAVKANAILSDDAQMKSAVNAVAGIIEIVKKVEPGRNVSTLIGNAIVGRFDLTFLMIKVYGRQRKGESPPPAGTDCFISDPSRPDEICLFKLTLNHVREVVRLYCLSLEECQRRGHFDADPPAKLTRKDDKDVVVMPKKKRPVDKLNDWIRSMRNDLVKEYGNNSLPLDENPNKTSRETLLKLEDFANECMQALGIIDYFSYPTKSVVKTAISKSKPPPQQHKETEELETEEDDQNAVSMNRSLSQSPEPDNANEPPSSINSGIVEDDEEEDDSEEVETDSDEESSDVEDDDDNESLNASSSSCESFDEEDS